MKDADVLTYNVRPAAVGRLGLSYLLGPYLLAKLLAHGATYAVGFIGRGGLAVAAGVSMLTHEPSRRADKVLALGEGEHLAPPK